MDGHKPVGMKEFRLQKTDGTYAEQDAAVSASYTCTTTSLDAVNDGEGWETSAENGNPKGTCRPTRTLGSTGYSTVLMPPSKFSRRKFAGTVPGTTA